ncbi:MAG: monovalent cation/H(+) antiporter subunit G [Paracoccaceae bacterium]
MSIQSVAEYGAAICLLIGSGFVLVGVIGLLKFNEPMSRLHAPTKVGTIGIGMLLLASILHSIVLGDASTHELLIMAFLFVTAPISANFIAKVHLHHRVCQTPPPPPLDDTWSTLNTPDTDQEIKKSA